MTRACQDCRSPLPFWLRLQRPFPITHSNSTFCPHSNPFCALTRPFPSDSVLAFVEVADPALREGLTSELFILGRFFFCSTSPRPKPALTHSDSLASSAHALAVFLTPRHHHSDIHTTCTLPALSNSDRPHLYALSNRTRNPFSAASTNTLSLQPPLYIRTNTIEQFQHQLEPLPGL